MTDERDRERTASPFHAGEVAVQERCGVREPIERVGRAVIRLLGIELATRRRNRLNGTVTDLDHGGFTVALDQSFGNCPQYIQARTPVWRRPSVASRERHAPVVLGARLDAAARALVARTDTLFVASASAAARGHAGPEGVDVSHRGGKPGL